MRRESAPDLRPDANPPAPVASSHLNIPVAATMPGQGSSRAISGGAARLAANLLCRDGAASGYHRKGTPPARAAGDSTAGGPPPLSNAVPIGPRFPPAHDRRRGRRGHRFPVGAVRILFFAALGRLSLRGRRDAHIRGRSELERNHGHGVDPSDHPGGTLRRIVRVG